MKRRRYHRIPRRICVITIKANVPFDYYIRLPRTKIRRRYRGEFACTCVCVCVKTGVRKSNVSLPLHTHTPRDLFKYADKISARIVPFFFFFCNAITASFPLTRFLTPSEKHALPHDVRKNHVFLFPTPSSYRFDYACVHETREYNPYIVHRRQSASECQRQANRYGKLRVFFTYLSIGPWLSIGARAFASGTILSKAEFRKNLNTVRRFWV